MVQLLARVARIRRRFLNELTDPRNYFSPRVATNAARVLAVGWRVADGKCTLLLVANVDFRRRRRTVIERLPAGTGRRSYETLLELHRSRTEPKLESGRLRLSLEPGDGKVLLL
jgi:hypothetical protein